MSIERGKGSLLTVDVDALVNTVNTEGVMGKGLALQFKKAFPENFASYERACKSGAVKTGQVHIVQRLASVLGLVPLALHREDAPHDTGGRDAAGSGRPTSRLAASEAGKPWRELETAP